MMNSTNLTGRLTKDPELKYSQSGVAVCNFTLAVNRSFTNAQGEREADFPQIVAFKGTAESVANYLTKGSLVAVEGRLQTRTYEAEAGHTVYVTEIVANNVHFLESKSQADDRQDNQSQNQNRGRQNNRGNRR